MTWETDIIPQSLTQSQYKFASESIQQYQL